MREHEEQRKQDRVNETESDDESESDASDSLIPIDKLPPFPPLDGDLLLEILNIIGTCT